MLTGDPLVSMAIYDNVYLPFILFCSVNITPIQILGAYYYDDLIMWWDDEPFGFVTEYCFQYRDLDNTSDKVGNDVEKGDDDKDSELTGSEIRNSV
ncbi:12363_t:CDS:2 [Rhizophagus irregularis]|nr:12363_t:CDS:2 [Rhizophagus irregularis]